MIWGWRVTEACQLCSPFLLALTYLPSLFLPGSSRTGRMGSACIKVTKYFLFLFNLLFFVSMTSTSRQPPTETLPWGSPG